MSESKNTPTPDLIDRRALLKKLRDERDEYVRENFVTDPETGASESSQAKEDYLCYLDERIEMIEKFPKADINRSPLFEEMVKALEPFARLAEQFNSYAHDDNWRVGARNAVSISVGDLRSAAAILAKARSGEVSAPDAPDRLGAVQGTWLPIESAPRDGTLIQLLIGPGADRDQPLEDTEGGSRTIGFNNFDHDGEDVWKFAGWCWSNDYFTEGVGKPTMWQPCAPADGDAPKSVPDPILGEAVKALRDIRDEANKANPDREDDLLTVLAGMADDALSKVAKPWPCVACGEHPAVGRGGKHPHHCTACGSQQ